MIEYPQRLICGLKSGSELWRDMKMGKNILEYKGYVVKVCYDAKRCLLYGKVDGIVDAVNFETENHARWNRRSTMR